MVLTVKILTTKNAPDMMTDEWTPQDESEYAPLRRKRLRIEAKLRRDKNRKKEFRRRKPPIH